MTGMEKKIIYALTSMTVLGGFLPATAEMSETRVVTTDTALADGTKTEVISDTGMSDAMGIQVAKGATLSLGNNTQTTVMVTESGMRRYVIGLDVQDAGSKVQGGTETRIQVTRDNGDSGEVTGIRAQESTTLKLGDHANIVATIKTELSDESESNSTTMHSYGLENTSAAMELGGNAVINSSGYVSTGILTKRQNGVTTLGDAAQITTVSGYGHESIGVDAEDDGKNILGRNSFIMSRGESFQGAGGQTTFPPVIGLQAKQGGENFVGDGSNIQASSPDGYATGVSTESQGVNTLSNNLVITAEARLSATGISTASQGGKTVAGNGLIVTAKGETWTNTCAIVTYGVTEIGDDASLTAQNITGNLAGIDTQSGGTTTVGNRATIKVSKAETSRGTMGISTAGGTTQIGTDASITVNGAEGRGIYTDTDGTTTVGNHATITVNGEEGTGIFSEGGSTTAGDNASITVTGENGIGILSEDGKEDDGTNIEGTTTIGDNAAVSAEATGVESNQGGTVTFTGAASIVGGQHSLLSKDTGSLIDFTANGTKIIRGDMMAQDGGTIDGVMDTGASRFTGASTVADADSTINLDMSNGAQWNMTGGSSVTNLTLNSGAVVNMTANPDYQQLSAENFSGNDGIFYMKTDLDSQTDGDKVHITQADAGSTGKVQVYDASLTSGKEVTGTRHLLLITDDSGKASFTGETLNRGGLWDVTPTIQNGSYVRDTMGVADAKDTEWYLTKVEKTVNADSRPLLFSGDDVYGMYRHTLDTLRQRRGNLRQRDKQEDADGIWVRDRGGRMTGDGWDSKYNIFQLGYEYSENPTNIYGIFGERGIASPDYKTGTGKEHTLAGGVYGTWFGHHGTYTDVVAKLGRDDSHVTTFGPYPDTADYRTREQSLSVEYGKTIYRGKKREFFLEPQAQFVWGHFNDTSYTTARGTHVERDAFNSAIGRLGIVLGKTHDEGRHPFDYYLKASVLHEFGNGQDVHMRAANGEFLDTSIDYGETWYEVGFGGTYRLSPSATMYADAERTFSSDIKTNWQVNAGLTWQF